MKTPAIFLAAVASLCTSFAADPSPQARAADVPAVLKRIDELYRSGSSRATVEMQIRTPHWERTLRMRIWSEGTDKTFIRIDEPLKEKGVATLRVGNEMWNYLPKTDKVIKVPPSMMMSSWMGSDFTNDDLVKEYTFLEDYTFEEIAPEDPEPGLITIKCLPREGVPVVWGHVMIAAHERNAIPVWERFYDEKGALLRELRFEDVRTLGGRTIPTTLILEPKTKEGHRTVLRYLEAAFDIPLEAGTFTLRNLRSPG